MKKRYFIKLLFKLPIFLFLIPNFARSKASYLKKKIYKKKFSKVWILDINDN
tara:strand:+ start:954 stop:1109 length:156 start_codon:yes stop_codon:yes gene_type:complete